MKETDVMFDRDAFWRAQTLEHVQVAQESFRTLQPDFDRAVELCVRTLRAGGKLMFFGNGGSAADAQHLATEFAVRYIHNRRAYAALALTTDSSALTAAGNDLGFEQIFARQIEALGRAGDAAIAISTSGRSPNVLHALTTARSLDIATLGLTGADGGAMNDLCDVCLRIPSTTTARIQEMHITLGQMLVGAVETILERGFSE
jgi:D-sedoheptulose 7-phosphate isomerase